MSTISRLHQQIAPGDRLVPAVHMPDRVPGPHAVTDGIQKWKCEQGVGGGALLTPDSHSKGSQLLLLCEPYAPVLICQFVLHRTEQCVQSKRFLERLPCP